MKVLCAAVALAFAAITLQGCGGGSTLTTTVKPSAKTTVKPSTETAKGKATNAYKLLR